MDRVEILRNLRLGVIDVLVGVNLLREGLDLPEVSLVAIMDADKEGFLRNVRSLIQTIGRAARNDKGKVIMYADKITHSMQVAIDETQRRRKLQTEYNVANNITPRTVTKSKEAIMAQTSIMDSQKSKKYYVEPEELGLAAEPVVKYMTAKEIDKLIDQAQKSMEKAAKELNFIEAARLRDEWLALKKMKE
jgi:excinuclease ABC subunit B